MGSNPDPADLQVRASPEWACFYPNKSSSLFFRPRKYFWRVGCLDLPLVMRKLSNSFGKQTHGDDQIPFKPRVSSLPELAFQGKCILRKKTWTLQGHKPRMRKSWNPGNRRSNCPRPSAVQLSKKTRDPVASRKRDFWEKRTQWFYLIA